MPTKNSNSNNDQDQQSNANAVQNNYGEQVQGVFDELTETDEKSGLAFALNNAKVSHEDSVFDDDDNDDLYDDEYNYESSYDEEEENDINDNPNSDSGGLIDAGSYYYSENDNPIGGNVPLGLKGNSIVDNKNNKTPNNKPAAINNTVNSEANSGDNLAELLMAIANSNIPPAMQNILMLQIMKNNNQVPSNDVPSKNEAAEIIEETTDQDINTIGTNENEQINDGGNGTIPAPEETVEEIEEEEGLSFGDIEPIPGIKFENINVKKGSGRSLEGTADLDINIATPQLTGQAPQISITFDPASKSIGFTTESLTLNSALGEISISELSLEGKELKASEAHFTFDSSKSDIGALISGETENKFSDLFALGVVLDIIGHDISISAENGFQIGEIEKHLTDLKLRVFGEDFEYDAEEGKASLQKEIHLLEFLTSQTEISKEMTIPIILGSEATFNANISGDDTAVLDIVIEKPEDDYEFTISGDIGGLSLSANITGEANVDLKIASANADLEANGNITLENSMLEASGSFEAEGNTGIITPKPSSFALSAKLIMPLVVDLILNLSAKLLFFTKEKTIELEQQELARFEVDKSWNWEANAEDLSGDIDTDDLIPEEGVNAIIKNPKNFLKMF